MNERFKIKYCKMKKLKLGQLKVRSFKTELSRKEYLTIQAGTGVVACVGLDTNQVGNESATPISAIVLQCEAPTFAVACVQSQEQCLDSVQFVATACVHYVRPTETGCTAVTSTIDITGLTGGG